MAPIEIIRYCNICHAQWEETGIPFEEETNLPCEHRKEDYSPETFIVWGDTSSYETWDDAMDSLEK